MSCLGQCWWNYCTIIHALESPGLSKYVWNSDKEITKVRSERYKKGQENFPITDYRQTDSWRTDFLSLQITRQYLNKTKYPIYDFQKLIIKEMTSVWQLKRVWWLQWWLPSDKWLRRHSNLPAVIVPCVFWKGYKSAHWSGVLTLERVDFERIFTIWSVSPLHLHKNMWL